MNSQKMRSMGVSRGLMGIWRSQGRQGDGTPMGCETRNVTVSDNANLSFGPTGIISRMRPDEENIKRWRGSAPDQGHGSPRTGWPGLMPSGAGCAASAAGGITLPEVVIDPKVLTKSSISPKPESRSPAYCAAFTSFQISLYLARRGTFCQK